MSPIREDLKHYIPQFETLGIEAVQGMLDARRYGHDQELAAVSWLAEKRAELRRCSDASRAEEIELTRSARDAAWEANDIARDAASSARTAASEARSANVLAEAANRNSADLAEIQRRYNKIALTAMAISAIALIVSIFVAVSKK